MADLTTMSVEILNGCRATTGLTPLDFAAAVGIAKAGTGKNGMGMRLGVTPVGWTQELPVYCIVDNDRMLVGIKTDFEKLGLEYGKACDRLDTLKEKQRPTG